MKKRPRHSKQTTSPLENAVSSYGCIPVSCIADEYFCEVKVHLELGHPEVDQGSAATIGDATEMTAWDRSRQQHASLAASAENASLDLVQKQIKTGKPTVALEFGLGADFGRLPIGGIPDAVCFERHRAVCVLDYKSKDFERAPHLFPSDEVQLQLYGLLLERLALVSEALLLACVYFPSSTPMATLSRSQLQRVPHLCWSAVKKVSVSAPASRSAMHHPAWTPSPVRIAPGVTVTIVAVRYHPEDANKYVAWATPYWLGKREPIPTSKPQRCAACRVNDAGLCSVARAPFGTMR